MSQQKDDRELDPNVQPDAAGGEDETPTLDALAAAAAEAEAAAGGGEDVRAALERKTREAADAQDKYLRTYADFENYRKRMQRDMAEFKKYANEQIALDLLSVVDHLALAIKHSRGSGGAEQGFQEGVELVYKQFLDLLEKYGVKPFKAEGEPFDPRLHDAIMQVETADQPENTVAAVLQDGYLYHEKVLRHARVGVAKRPAGPPPETAAGNDEDAED